MRQWSYSEGEIPLEYVKCIYRGDRYKFITNIARKNQYISVCEVQWN